METELKEQVTIVRKRMLRRILHVLCLMTMCIHALVAHAEWNNSNSTLLNLELNKGKIIAISKNVGTIFVADPSIADYHVRAPGILYIYAKKIGETSLYATSKSGKVAFKYIVRVTQDLSQLDYLLKEIVPGATIKVMSAGDNVILRGTVKSAAQAEDARHLVERYMGDPAKVLTFLHVSAPTQINLRVQVIEMTREVIRSLGINWTGGFATNNTKFLVNPILIPSDFAVTGTTPNAINFTADLLNRGNFSIQSIINVLEQNGLVTILSEPNLTALSGQTASFLVGGEFPIPIPQGNTGAVTVMFKKFGVSLAFTPTILENGKINLQVRPEVSQLSTEGAVNINGFQVPSLSTRRAQTTVELRSGQSFSIAGLLQNNANKMVQQLPGVSQIPVLGRLFRSERFQRNETELVIIVTPYIVQPASNDGLLYPTDNANADITLSYCRRCKNRNVGFILD